MAEEHPNKAQHGWRDRIGRQRLYSDDFPERDDVVLWDVVQVQPLQMIKITFVSTNSPDYQGIRLAVDVSKGHLEISNVSSKAMEIWEHTAPREVICNCISPEGLLSVYNLHECQGTRWSQAFGSAMLIEDRGSLRTYRCNDSGVGADVKFDKLVFTLELLD